MAATGDLPAAGGSMDRGRRLWKEITNLGRRDSHPPPFSKQFHTYILRMGSRKQQIWIFDDDLACHWNADVGIDGMRRAYAALGVGYTDKLPCAGRGNIQ